MGEGETTILGIGRCWDIALPAKATTSGILTVVPVHQRGSDDDVCACRTCDCLFAKREITMGITWNVEDMPDICTEATPGTEILGSR